MKNYWLIYVKIFIVDIQYFSPRLINSFKVSAPRYLMAKTVTSGGRGYLTYLHLEFSPIKKESVK